ncbi:Small conductance mechanosensitive ion channel [Hondaea fermentalgiana]|uniref:Small conductance mechanosensitive ion channel n=1 Tax=Hondaea fermentalgiana TaxID=2315210 RepID=A0A2R5GZB9_9STRA|nr:Small conductance mechanosensitive ion channel [Hondaea fermentalgiana]|eukprot:GBG34103.1 Small conductance mechanosensitive ion channel [Hondaea fermentalgiana]
MRRRPALDLEEPASSGGAASPPSPRSPRERRHERLASLKTLGGLLCLGALLIVFPEARYVATGDREWLAGKETPILDTAIGPGRNLVLNYLRWILAVALLVYLDSIVENKIHEYAETTERNINERRSSSLFNLPSKDSTDDEDEDPLMNSESTPLGAGLDSMRRSRQMYMVDMFLVKILLVFFPSVQVQRLSLAQAVRTASLARAAGFDLGASPSTASTTDASREPSLEQHGVGGASGGAHAVGGGHSENATVRTPLPLRRFMSTTVEHGIGLITFHRGITRTNTPMTERLVSWCTLIVLVSLATLATLELGISTKQNILKILRAACVLRVFVPLSTAAAVIMEDLIARTGSQSILKDSWKILTSALQMCLWLVTGTSVLASLGFDMSSYVAGLGISSIAAAFAAQAALRDMIATASLLADHPFSMGDRVVFNGTEAIVRRIGFRSTHFVTTYNGETMVVPNGELISGKIFNRTKMRRRRVKNHLCVHYETSPRRMEIVRDLIERAFADAPQAEFVYAHLMELGPRGARFEYVFELPGNDNHVYKDAQHAINLALFRLFSENSIQLTLFQDETT